MAEVTKTEISVEDFPLSVVNGTGRRRAKILVRATSGATSNTLDLSTYVSNLAGIEGVNEWLDGAANGGTASTWSGTTITYAGHAGSGVWVQEVTGYFS